MQRSSGVNSGGSLNITESARPSRPSIPTGQIRTDLSALDEIGGGKTAFVTDRDGDNEIYLLTLPGIDNGERDDIS